jgi:hypothetical protein
VNAVGHEASISVTNGGAATIGLASAHGCVFRNKYDNAMRYILTVVLSTLMSVTAASSIRAQTVTTPTGAPNDTRTSVDFDLDTAAVSVSKVEIEDGMGGWTEMTDDVCVTTPAGSNPKVIKRSGTFTQGRRIRITIGAWANVDGVTWGTRTCTAPVG